MEGDPRPPQDASPLDPGAPFLFRKDVLMALGVFAGACGVIAAILVSGARGETYPDGTTVPSDSSSPTAAASPNPTVETAAPGNSPGTASLIVPEGQDERTIADLARLSVTLLPDGTWPELYDDFVPAFREQCSLEEFTQVGVDGAAALGGQLELVDYRGLNELTITGDTARAVIVSELEGLSESLIEAHFERIDGRWLLAPGPGLEGCAAFGRISG